MSIGFDFKFLNTILERYYWQLCIRTGLFSVVYKIGGLKHKRPHNKCVI